MIDRQEYLRKEVKRVKWEGDISFKEIAEQLLEMHYNSFMNWLHGYCRLGYARFKLLQEYIETMKE